ncbi:hypothetical protein AWM75_02500 [Aerococcus urinaehominis]|uniref:Manganese transport regulator n=1 Tax=Aerococcus urinaehominis TaxID=128944 RepID=A0A120IAS0_9LACT|nr:metal-dependent transcriptional regulator [Aerococcus urinaehominis]AMB98933.1 hypothetical protein AWM75_02500 [Aerococcus urinaehominis]SDM40232.1 iron (metal) dependent repressor, DtxR family [Aerococcus urinaehominis]
MSISRDDYMKTILELGGSDKKIANKAIRQVLDVSAASVTEMLNRLQAEELIAYTPYQGVMLTDQGRLFALQVLRLHRLWEVFLYEKLNYSLDEVHEEAEKLEHMASPQFIDRLEAYLDYPAYCPHGGAIPNKDGKSEPEAKLALAQVPAGSKLELRRVVDEKELLAYIERSQLKLNQTYLLAEIDPYSETYQLVDQAGQEYRIVSKVAKQIFVNIID